MKLPKHIRFLLGVYLMGILFFTGFRLITFSLQWDRFLALPSERNWLMAQAFFMGWRFDTVISGYLLAVPVVLLTFSALTGIGGRPFYKSISIFLGTVYPIAFAVCAVDAPYFQYFFSRLNTAAFNWFNTPDFVLNVLLDEWLYITLFLILLLVVGLFWRWLNGWRKRSLDEVVPKSSFSFTLLLSLTFMGLTFLGIRGRLDEKSPIRVGTAAFSTHALPNQLGLNPVFTLVRSALNDLKAENRSIKYMEDDQAVKQVRSYFGLSDSIELKTPISRKIPGKDKTISPNVIVIMLESMSAQKMGRYGHPLKLTPFLDSLATVSYTFDSIYTAGIHTYNGLYSTLFSMPALGKQHAMNVVPIPRLQGLPTQLKAYGYQTIHFMTHDDQFDNVAGFFSTNGYDRIVSKKDYPSDQVLSTLGVPDHFMFEFAVPTLNDAHKKQKPFFASFMTTSDHVPYFLPKNLPYTPRDLAPNYKIIEYVDWSVRQFIEQSSKQPWFENTLFVILADHGQYVDGIYDMPLSYHHTPLIFYAPKLLDSTITHQEIGLQIDVFPTIMNILGNEWVNHTLGIDLLNEQRPFAYFSADNKYGVLGKEYYLVVREDGNVSLYKYKTRETKNYLLEQPAIAKKMRDYAETMIHVAQMMK